MRVVESLVPIDVTVNFVPESKYQFFIDYDFKGLFVTSAFRVSIRLNRDYGSCFSPSDFNQVLDVTIDPAFLVCADIVQNLNLNNLDGEDIPAKCFK